MAHGLLMSEKTPTDLRQITLKYQTVLRLSRRNIKYLGMTCFTAFYQWYNSVSWYNLYYVFLVVVFSILV